MLYNPNIKSKEKNMQKVDITKSINMITKEDFEQNRPQYKPTLYSEVGDKLFDIIVTPETILELIYFTKLTKSPAVQVVVDKIKDSGLTKLEDREKQYIGVIVCEILENNGFCKSGKKSTVKGDIFSTGEVYIKSN
jgi:hypothetical protein